MNKVSLLLLLFVMLESIHDCYSACCGPYYMTNMLSHCDNYDPKSKTGYCLDCSSPTPFCGKNACNIFGCNCVCKMKPKKFRHPDDKKFIYTRRQIFSELDTDHNNFLSLNEIQQSYPNFTQNDFDSIDKNKDEKIDYPEFSDA